MRQGLALRNGNGWEQEMRPKSVTLGLHLWRPRAPCPHPEDLDQPLPSLCVTSLGSPHLLWPLALQSPTRMFKMVSFPLPTFTICLKKLFQEMLLMLPSCLSKHPQVQQVCLAALDSHLGGFFPIQLGCPILVTLIRASSAHPQLYESSCRCHLL